MKHGNDMWKLDLLEVKFNSSSPRFPHTKKLIQARNNSKLLRKLPTNPEEAEQQIAALKKDFFDRKYYAAVKKLEKEVSKLTKAKNDDEDVKKFISKTENILAMVTSKIIKIVQQSILVNKELRTNPPTYISKDVVKIIGDKSDPRNPSKFFIDNCQTNKKVNNYISNLWNSKQVRTTLADIEWSFKMVRGDLSKQEKDARKAQTGKSVEDDNGGDEDDNEDGSDSEQSDSDEDSDMEIPPVGEEVLEKFAVYESGDENEEAEQFAIDPSVNYNEITDEEPSEVSSDELDIESEQEDDFFEESTKAPKKESKHKLPEMATGYFSGGESDSDVDNDEVVKKVTTQRKNRRGQRARQKIWEQKYGKQAKHVQEEKQRYHNEREQKQKEFEERQRRREEKAKLAMENAPSGSNVLPLGERKKRAPGSSDDATTSTASAPAPVEKVHPSWEAKRLAEEKQKNVKFTGKKITFD